MKAQTHGSAFAMETARKFAKTSIDLFSVILSVALLLATVLLTATGCAYNPPKDKNGNSPDDAVRQFITFVNNDNYASAKMLWYGHSKRISQPIDFVVFCSRYKNIDLSKCRISKASRGKSGFSMVNVDWEENGEKKHDSFGLKIIDGEWKMERGYYW